MALPSKPLFLGTFRHLLDVKNRLTIPSRWRIAGDDQAELYVALPQPDHIVVLPPLEVERLYERSASKDLADFDAQASMQKLFAMAHSFGCDKQGRAGLPEEMLTRAGIPREGEAVLVGGMSRFAIWAPDRWAKVDPRSTGESIGDVMRRLNV